MKLFFVLVFMSTMSSAFAAFSAPKFAVGGGVFINQNETTASSGTAEEEVSVTGNLGGRAVFDLSESFFLRTGLYLQQKSAKYTLDFPLFWGDVEAKVLSTAIPLNLEYKFNEYIRVFGGYSLDYNISDTCDADGDFDGCKINKNKMKSYVHYANVGLSFWVNNKLDLDVSYQRALSETYTDIEIHSYLVQVFYKFN